MSFKPLLLLSFISLPVLAQLQAMDMDDMDAILSKTGEFTSQSYEQAISIQANFDVGTDNGKISHCSNQKPRRKTSFYSCLNGQSKEFLSKLAFALRNQKVKSLKSQFKFNLNNKGQLENIKINGINDLATRQQLNNLLKKMEFGYSNDSQVQSVSLNITTQAPHN